MMPPGAELACAAPRSCASRRATASRRWRAGCARWAPTIDEFPDGFHLRGAAAARRDGRCLRRSPAGDGVRHRRHAGRAARRRSPAPPRSTYRIPGSSRRSIGSLAVTVDKIFLVGFMAAGKTTVARALAARLGWRAEDVDELIEARERRTVADIFARQGEPYFRARRARDPAAAPARCATSSSPPAAARSWIRTTGRR